VAWQASVYRNIKRLFIGVWHEAKAHIVCIKTHISKRTNVKGGKSMEAAVRIERCCCNGISAGAACRLLLARSRAAAAVRAAARIALQRAARLLRRIIGCVPLTPHRAALITQHRRARALPEMSAIIEM